MEKKEKNKRVFRALLKGTLRGLVKMLPFGIGNIFVEANDALADSKMPDKKLINDPGLSMDDAVLIDKIRRVTQILIQTAFAGLIIYAFLTKQINFDQLLEYVSPEPVGTVN